MQYTDSYNESILSFVNNVKTSDGGSHEVGFKTGIKKAFNDYAKSNNLIKGKDGNFDGSDVREGLTAVINLKVPENIAIKNEDLSTSLLVLLKMLEEKSNKS